MKSTPLKELAKFAAGITVWEFVVHISFALCDMLPLKFCGVTVTTEINTFQIIATAMVSVFLIWFAWLRKVKDHRS